MVEMRMISPEDVEGYVKTGGGRCPFCKSPEVEPDTMLFYDEDTSSVYRGMTCLTCFRDWTDIFRLVDMKPETYEGPNVGG